jgi:hypothetical protein
MPRARKPNELHKLHGTYRADRHGVAAGVVEPITTEAVQESPDAALSLLLAEGVAWLGRTDAPALALLRSMLQEREGLHAAALAGSTGARTHLRALDKQVIGLLTDLGFTPTARSRLGLAEVKAASKLDEFRARQANRLRTNPPRSNA